MVSEGVDKETVLGGRTRGGAGSFEKDAVRVKMS
jgi:hypothetical protein